MPRFFPFRNLRFLPATLVVALAATSAAQPPVRPASLGSEAADARPLLFPTDNTALLDRDPSRFYMGLVRNYGSERVWTWEGGTYGYVRNATETPVGWRFTRFHEGVDIAPTMRDSTGEPLDEVRAVDAGRVVYVNRADERSDYGRYLVVEHEWGGSAYYTLYAHLAVNLVREGERVRRGEPIGILGYTGTGLDQDRAHLHFEVNLMLNRHFETWRNERRPRWRATHGRYHGLNLAGMPPAAILEASRGRPLGGVTHAIAEAVGNVGEDVTVLAPAGPPPELLARYPWLCGTCGPGGPPDWSWSWEVGLTRSGLPVRVEPSERRAETLRLLRVAPHVTADYLHSRILDKRGPGADLNSTGQDILSLMFARPGMVPAW